MRTVTVRKRAAQLFCASVLAAQAYAVVHAYHDPLKRFGFQPFAESTTWRARIEAVDGSGRRQDIADGFQGYRWDELVRERVVDPFHTHDAKQGIDASLYFLQRALDYVADHTPNDRGTRYLEATVWYRKNRRPEAQVTLRSHTRALP